MPYNDIPAYENSSKDNKTESFSEQSKDTKEEDVAYKDSIKEARLCYKRLEEISESLPKLKDFDFEVYSQFNSAFEVAMKTAKFINGDVDKENKAFKFYNYVETLHKWCKGITDLGEKGVYASLLNNIKKNAKEALPVLQDKINNEYIKFVNPDIYDLESEMTVMSKDIY